jgi:hypothetical protein
MNLTADQIRAKIIELSRKRAEKEEKYRKKMRFYRGVIHESAASELKHQEVKVLESYLDSIDREIAELKRKLDESGG